MLNLFKPGKIGGMQLKNRIVMAALGTRGLSELDGRFSERGIQYLAARAAGGTGMIITGIVYVDVEVEPHLVGPFCAQPRADLPIFLASMEELANAVHAHEAKLAIQLTAGRGRIAPASEQKAGRAIAPSPVSCFWPPHLMPRELGIAEIEKLVKAFGNSAALVKAAGIDAIELHGHEGYLMDQFSTSLWNKRTDKYGGDLENRLRFSLEIIEAIRKEVGPTFPIIYKFGASHHLEGAREVEEALDVARRLERAGVDALDVDAGCYETAYWAHPPTYMPPGCLLEGIEAVKKVVDIPVIAVGKLGYPKLAEKVLAEGKADFVALGRPLLADPDWPLKVKEGRPEDIRMCTGCHECFHRIMDTKYLSCAVNPATGMEKALALRPAVKKKSVLIIGGGPAGMEAARVAALRGLDVTLWEKSDRLGGNLLPASVPDFKMDYAAFKDYLLTQVNKLLVNVELSKEATIKTVQKMAPDEVIIATGSAPLTPDIPGASKSNVIAATDALLGKKRLGKNVVVIGGGSVGCEVALWLARQGKKVSIIEVLPEILQDMYFMNKMMLLKMVKDAGIGVETGAKLSEVTGEGAVIRKNGRARTLRADTLILAVGMKAENSLLKAMQDKFAAVHAIGDCVEPRTVMSAIWEAYNIARLL